MPIVWKLDHPIDVIDSALAHHLGILRREVNRRFSLEFREHYSDSAVRVYDLEYLQGGVRHTSDDDLGRIKLRKLSEHRTEITISDSYLSSESESRQSLYTYFRSIEHDDSLSEEVIEKMISEREATREKILEKLRSGFEDDGLLGANDKNIQTKESTSNDFIDKNRIRDLRSVTAQKLDLSKLLRLCEEINSSYTNENYYAVAMLLRALLDHIPPIFGLDTFEQVVAQYGNKSFKENMGHLDKSLRKIADSYLHLPIRKKEILPNKNQVNFSADLDVLLAEIARVLK